MGMEPEDHPELDESEIAEEDDIAKYQMLRGCPQWAVSLGRFDIQYAVNTMARFAVCPREGHMKRMLRIFGYLKYHTKGRLRFDLSEPLIDSLDFKDFEWNELYPEATEEIPYDAPNTKPTTNDVTIVCHCDSDHGHDLLTRRSVTGFVISINKTPIKFYSKRQNTVESSSYGSELVAGRIATEAIMEYRYKLRMMGIKVEGPSILMIDNQSVVANTTLPSSSLKKKHNSIAYHRMREAVAAGIIKVGFIRSATNLADILTKPIGPSDYWNLLSEVFYGRERGAEGELQNDEPLGEADLIGHLERQGPSRTYARVSRLTTQAMGTRRPRVDSSSHPRTRCYYSAPKSGRGRRSRGSDTPRDRRDTGDLPRARRANTRRTVPRETRDGRPARSAFW